MKRLALIAIVGFLILAAMVSAVLVPHFMASNDGRNRCIPCAGSLGRLAFQT